jgi:hypothetical protein
MAVLAANDLAEHWPIAEVVVFGCPRTGTGTFAQSYQTRSAGPGAVKKLGEITTRHIMETDVVVRVPPPLVFVHVGKKIHVSETGNQIDSPAPLAVRVVKTAYGPQPDDPSPDTFSGVLLMLLRPIAPAAMAMAIPIMGAIGVIGVLTGLALQRDGMMHAAERYRRALDFRRYMIERVMVHRDPE